MHTYATLGVSSIIADYVLAELTPQAFAAKLRDPTTTIWVAEGDAHLMGLAVIQRNTPCPAVPVATVELASLYVPVQCKGQGIGSGLLHRAQALAAHFQSALWLTVNAKNTTAIDFYLRHQFQDQGAAQFVLGGVAHENRILLG